MTPELKKQIEDYLAKDEIEQALERLKTIAKNEANRFLGQLSSLLKLKEKGTLRNEDFYIQKNGIRDAVWDCLQRIEKETLEHNEQQDSNPKAENLNTREANLNIDLEDRFLNQLEHFLHQQPQYMPGNIKAKVWSLVFLDWQIKQLNQLKARLNPHNFTQLIVAIDELGKQNTTLLEIMQQSGNSDSDAYDAAILMDQHRVSLRSSLESIDPDDWTLEVGISKLQQSIDDLICELEEKRSTAFQFSSN